jgi:hypothetical protein
MKQLFTLTCLFFCFLSNAEGTYYYDDKDNFQILGIRYYDFGQPFNKVYNLLSANKNAQISAQKQDVVIHFNNKKVVLKKEICASYYVKLPDGLAFEENLDGIVYSMMITLYHGQIVKVTVNGKKEDTEWNLRCINSTKAEEVNTKGLFSMIHYFESDKYYSLQWYNLDVLEKLYNKINYLAQETKKDISQYNAFGNIELGTSIKKYPQLASIPTLQQSKYLSSAYLEQKDFTIFNESSLFFYKEKKDIKSIKLKLYGNYIYSIEIEYTSSIDKSTLASLGKPDLIEYENCKIKKLKYETDFITIETKENNTLILNDIAINYKLNTMYTSEF